MSEKKCLHCGRELKSLHPRVQYCSESHKSRGYQVRQEAMAWRARFGEQEAKLTAAAPAGSHSYRVGIRRVLAGELVYFPRKGPGFRLAPFEGPRVPIAGNYAVEFFTDSGQSLGTPSQVISGLYIHEADPKVCF